MKLWKKLTAAALMSAAMLGAGLTAMPVTGYEVLTYVTNNNDTVTVGDLKFSLYEDHAEVIWQNDKNASSVTIPAEVNGLPVTHIGSAVFRYMEELEHVTIPDSVTVIGYEAFSGCKALTDITIPDSVTIISTGAFTSCTNLQSITIPESITSIYTYAFENCTSLQSITIPDSLTDIGSDAFSGTPWLKAKQEQDPLVVVNGVLIDGTAVCDGYPLYTWDGIVTSAEVTIPDTVTCIGPGAFCGCYHLSGVTIPDSVTVIGYSAFSFCHSLTNITIPDSVTFISSEAFSYCDSLTNITIPDSVTFISSEAFSYCDSLTNITIPDSVTKIDEQAFYGCTALTDLTIPDSVTEIGAYAFYGCTALTDITLPDSVTKIGACAFRETPWLEAKKKQTPLVIVNGILIDGTAAKGNTVISDTVKGFAPGAFQDNDQLTGITIPDRVTVIEDSTFSGCLELKNVKFHNNITAIGRHAFDSCEKLSEIILPDSLRSLDQSVFHASGLTGITIPEGVESIPKYAFDHCTSLKTVTLPESITEIGENAFFDCDSLTSIVLPDSITSIGNYAFFSCDSLSNIVLPDSITSIGVNVFKYCYSLNSIVLPDSVRKIGIEAFRYSGLINITIPESVTEIDRDAFTDCPNVTIRGKAGSYAEEYANENNIPFANLDFGSQPFSSVTLSKDSFTYNGKPVKVGKYITVMSGDTKLKYGTDFTLTYANNIKAGTASVTVTGIGNYMGTVKRTYKINTAVIDSVTLSKDSFSYTGKPIKVGSYLTVMSGDTKLKYGTDFTLTYYHNTDASKNHPCVVVDGIGSCTGSVKKIYEIKPILFDTVTLSKTSFDYTGKPVKVGSYLTVMDGDKKLKYGVDFDLEYSNNVLAGTATVTVTGKWNYTGFIKKTYRITPPAEDTVTLSKDSFTYTGKPVKIGSYLTVMSGYTKLKYGTDFTLSYANNVNCGVRTASVTVQKIGKYSGSITVYYTILPAQQAKPKLSMKDGKLHVEWTADASAQSYQVQYCRNRYFVGDTLHKQTYAVGRVSCNLSKYTNLREKWYVRVRACTEDEDGLHYGTWSDFSCLTIGSIDSVTLSRTEFAYTGNPVKIGKYITVMSGDYKLKYGVDFKLSYYNNTEPGRAAVWVSGLGEYERSTMYNMKYQIIA